MHMSKTTVESLKIGANNDISLPILTPHTAIFGFINGTENSVYKITNHTLSIFQRQTLPKIM